MREKRFIFGEDMEDTMKDAILLFKGISDKNGDLWIGFFDMSVALSLNKNFWKRIETQFTESLINDKTLNEDNRLAVQEKLQLIRKGLELMNEK